MVQPKPPQAQDSLRLLRKLFNGMEKRPSLMGGAAREGLDAHLLTVLAEFTNRHQVKSFSLVGPPPRRVSQAMALAILAQPHLSVTFSDLDPVGNQDLMPNTTIRPEEPLVIDQEVLCDALALSGWEIDNLRDEIDRRVSGLLKQQRALRWLWARYADNADTSDSLLNILFSGITDENSCLYGIAGQLYGLLDGECRVGPAGLYTPFAVAQDEDRVNPRHTFVGRFVDPSLVHSLAKGIGADEDEVVHILNTMICCLPQEQAAEFVDHDLWRIRSFDGMTDLCRGYTSTQWLFQPIMNDTMKPVDNWLELNDGKVDEALAQSCFDRAVIPRITTVLRQLVAQSLSNLLMEETHQPHHPKFPWVRLEDLDLMQLSHLFEAVAEPLLSWPKSENATEFFQFHLQINGKECADLQNQLEGIWAKRFKLLWAGAPRAKGHQSSLTRLLAYLSRSTISQRKVWHRHPIYNIPHKNVLALFAGFYFNELPIERCWADAGEAVGADPIGQWFWPTWERILNTMEDTSISTFSDFG